MSLPPRRILVVRGGAIGDFILTLPVFAALQARFPSAAIEILGYPGIAQLAVASGYASRAVPIESRGLVSFFSREGELSHDFQEAFERFDLIISYAYDPGQTFEINIRRCFSGLFLSGPHRPDDSSSLHATEWFLRPLSAIGIENFDPVPHLKFHEPANIQNTIAIHPGSGSARKNWPEERWSELIAELIDRTDARIVLIGGEAEGDCLIRLSHALPRDRYDLLQNQPLTEVGRRLRNCSLFLGHDSGISHLAAAAGARGIVLWGETNQNVWRPRSERMKLILAGKGLHDLDSQTVLRAVLEELQKAALSLV